jgi:putative transcriptional regulator
MTRHYSINSQDTAPSWTDCVHHVRAIRWRQGLNQNEFADRYGIPLGTLRAWEQDLAQPDAVARVLLMVIDERPDAVVRALRHGRPVAVDADGDLLRA